jgi:hypothetical protein
VVAKLMWVSCSLISEIDGESKLLKVNEAMGFLQVSPQVQESGNLLGLEQPFQVGYLYTAQGPREGLV